MANYNISIPDAVEDHRSDYALPIWEYLIDKVRESGEVHQSSIAEAVDCSVRTVQRVLEGFKRGNLVDWESYRGQGRGIKLVNYWLKKAKKIAEKLAWKRGYQSEDRYLKNPYSGEFQLGTTRLDYLGIPSGVLTKGDNFFRFFAMKFRKAVEGSTLARGSQDIVSTILNYLEGKPREVAKTFLIYLRNWLDGRHKYLGEFFKYFYDTLKDLARDKLSTIRQQKEIKQRMKEKKEVRETYQTNPPPRSKDYPSFAKYQKALEKWNKKSGSG